MKRRSFIRGALATTALPCLSQSGLAAEAVSDAKTSDQAVTVVEPHEGEDILAYIKRTHGDFDQRLFCQILGAASAFKEGDQAIGLAARDETSRKRARQLLANTHSKNIDAHAPHKDALFKYIQPSVPNESAGTPDETIGNLRDLILNGTEADAKTLASRLSSDVIACLVKIMANDQLISVGSKVFNPLPNSQIGSRGYMGARVQPNSPTDNVDDIRWQVFDAWSYAVGDVLLGTNPVSSTPKSVAAVELTLQEILKTFQLTNALPHCVLSHIDVQAEVETQHPGSTELWFQSIAGCDSANKTFDISIESMKRHAAETRGRFGLYFETGQGADFTNGHGHGFDMVVHESRKYGFARALTREVAAARLNESKDNAEPWVHLNDVAGFIGPEVFRTREQLVRCCLEDIVMGKLHGLCIGLDICSTLHMDITLADLDWCIDQIMPANPSYLMALPTKIDPMLGYLTTGFQDHVRVREKFDYKVNDVMWKFFQELNIIDASGKPTEHFGDPAWVYVQYRKRKGDTRTEQEIRAEATTQLAAVRTRGVFIAEGHGRTHSDLAPQLATDIKRIYDDAKNSIWAELPKDFVESIPNPVSLETRSIDRSDYILHPSSGEQLNEQSAAAITNIKKSSADEPNVQIVISDGLNALSISQPGHLIPFLEKLRSELADNGFDVAANNFVVNSGRVRAGYRIGESCFSQPRSDRRACSILHIIGERPGTGHRTFSVYITAAGTADWAKPDTVDHDITKVVSGIALTALAPQTAALQTVQLLNTLV